MKIYNTLIKKLETLPSPTEQKKLNMFVCGPTVYDYIHIGNARTFVIFDVVAKYLKYKGYDVDYIQNITDIDNKIIERAQKENMDPLEYAKKFSDIFKKDMQSLGVTAPEYKNATDHIPKVIKQVQALLNKGNAYPIENDGIYFDLSTFPDYGKLSGRTANMANDAVSRIDDSDKKRNRGDFALWKFSQPGDPTWSFETGEYLGIMDSAAPAFAKASAGRPGWHIEDTSITEKYFGPQYDIHGGGQDLIFPHHEAEIAQQESASGLKPFVKYWMHSGFLVNKDKKMSKSAGNFVTVHELINNLIPERQKEIVRFYLLSSHYREPLSFSFDILQKASEGVQRIYQFKQNLKPYLRQTPDPKSSEKYFADTEVNNAIEIAMDKFETSLNNDLNIPRAVASVFNLIREVGPLLVGSKISHESALEIEKFLNLINSILGTVSDLEVPNNISRELNQYKTAKDTGNYSEVENIRNQIKNQGWDFQDTPNGFIPIMQTTIITGITLKKITPGVKIYKK